MSAETEIKICGLSTQESVEAVCAAGGDLIGFIFFEKSPRHVSPEVAGSLAALARKTQHPPKTVAVTVNADDTYLDAIVSAMKPDILQLHGSESPQRVGAVKARYGQPVMKAFAIRESDDFAQIAAYEGIADRFLLDAKAPEGSDLPGGNGVSFDWSLLKRLKTDTPWMLSGGLRLDNINDALANSAVKAIDLSSGVESSPGVKDIAKIATFIKTVREMPA